MTDNFKMTDVESSSIEAIGFEAGTLRVRFKGGALYEYTPFSCLEWPNFREAESIGKFFYKNIRHNKNIICTKIKGKDNA